MSDRYLSKEQEKRRESQHFGDTIMREDHAHIFLEAAGEFNCWIIVRPLNLSSELFLDGSKFVAKPLSCKAKTANNPHHPLAGLVVSPDAVKNAFRDQEKAESVWRDFEWRISSAPNNSTGYSLEMSGPFAGCVKYRGRYVHGDYDLLAVIPLDAQGTGIPNDSRSLPQRYSREQGDIEYISSMVKCIKAFVNKRFCKEMVRHGADFDDMGDYRPGSEECEWFGPGRQRQKKPYVAQDLQLIEIEINGVKFKRPPRGSLH